MSDAERHEPQTDQTVNVPTPLRTEGDGPDYAVLLNGHPLSKGDAGGWDDGGFVICEGELDGELVDVRVAYGEKGVQGVTMQRGKEEFKGLDAVEDQPESGLLFRDEFFGESVTVRILPGTEAEA